MDKRSILIVVLLMFALFGVNMFFEQRHAETLRQWTAQQAAKKAETLQKLTQEVSARTAQVSSLPVVILYADEEAQTPLAAGVQIDKAVITVAWSNDLPKTIFAKGVDGEKTEEFALSNSQASVGSPIVYQSSSHDILKIGELPNYGKYDLQLVLPFLEDKQPLVYLGEYADGKFEIPLEKIAKLQKEIHSDRQISSPHIQEALVLIKTSEGYLPTAIYHGDHHTLEPLVAISSLSSFIEKPKQQTALTTSQKGAEKFFVLETPYQQLVFSNYGAALLEINLPFDSKSDSESVVKEIEFDREMVERHPHNAYFPAHPFYTYGKTPTTFEAHEQGKLGGYYPLLRRDLIEKDKSRSIRIPPRYYALNLVSEYSETAELVYDVKSFTKDSIVFETIQSHRRITKTYSVASEEQAPYCIDLTIKIEGDNRGLWITSGIPEVEWISGAPAPLLKYRSTRNQKAETQAIDLPKDSITVTSTPLDWACNSNGFFGIILDPLGQNESGYRAQKIPGNIVPSRLLAIGQEYQRFNAESMPGYMLQLPIQLGSGTMHFRVFAGPFADRILKTVDKVYSNPATGYNPDYLACQSFHGWFAFISEPFAKFLFILMNFFHSLTGSWALSIILLTVALRIMLYPLNAWSTKSMVRMQQIAPEVTAIQEKFKKDPKKAQLEIMNLYRERGVNPVSGCFPLLIQMPFLIGMFDLLKSTFELRGASFIPGWIDNLTAPDVLFSWNTPLPFIGNQFHLLPILLGIVMFLQQRLMSTAPKDPANMTEQQRQQRFMGNIMAVVFTVMFYNFPSGLNIYWLSSMLLGMLQQYWTTKRMNAKAAASVQTAVRKSK